MDTPSTKHPGAKILPVIDLLGNQTSQESPESRPRVRRPQTSRVPSYQRSTISSSRSRFSRMGSSTARVDAPRPHLERTALPITKGLPSRSSQPLWQSGPVTTSPPSSSHSVPDRLNRHRGHGGRKATYGLQEAAVKGEKRLEAQLSASQLRKRNRILSSPRIQSERKGLLSYLLQPDRLCLFRWPSADSLLPLAVPLPTDFELNVLLLATLGLEAALIHNKSDGSSDSLQQTLQVLERFPEGAHVETIHHLAVLSHLCRPILDSSLLSPSNLHLREILLEDPWSWAQCAKAVRILRDRAQTSIAAMDALLCRNFDGEKVASEYGNSVSIGGLLFRAGGHDIIIKKQHASSSVSDLQKMLDQAEARTRKLQVSQFRLWKQVNDLAVFLASPSCTLFASAGIENFVIEEKQPAESRHQVRQFCRHLLAREAQSSLTEIVPRLLPSLIRFNAEARSFSRISDLEKALAQEQDAFNRHRGLVSEFLGHVVANLKPEALLKATNAVLLAGKGYGTIMILWERHIQNGEKIGRTAEVGELVRDVKSSISRAESEGMALLKRFLPLKESANVTKEFVWLLGEFCQLGSGGAVLLLQALATSRVQILKKEFSSLSSLFSAFAEITNVADSLQKHLRQNFCLPQDRGNPEKHKQKFDIIQKELEWQHVTVSVLIHGGAGVRTLSLLKILEKTESIPTFQHVHEVGSIAAALRRKTDEERGAISAVLELFRADGSALLPDPNFGPSVAVKGISTRDARMLVMEGNCGKDTPQVLLEMVKKQLRFASVAALTAALRRTSSSNLEANKSPPSQKNSSTFISNATNALTADANHIEKKNQDALRLEREEARKQAEIEEALRLEREAMRKQAEREEARKQAEIEEALRLEREAMRKQAERDKVKKQSGLRQEQGSLALSSLPGGEYIPDREKVLILLEKGSLFENASEESMVEKLFCKHFVAQTYCMLFLQEVTVDAVDSLLQSVGSFWALETSFKYLEAWNCRFNSFLELEPAIRYFFGGPGGDRSPNKRLLDSNVDHLVVKFSAEERASVVKYLEQDQSQTVDMVLTERDMDSLLTAARNSQTLIYVLRKVTAAGKKFYFLGQLLHAVRQTLAASQGSLLIPLNHRTGHADEDLKKNIITVAAEEKSVQLDRARELENIMQQQYAELDQKDKRIQKDKKKRQKAEKRRRKEKEKQKLREAEAKQASEAMMKSEEEARRLAEAQELEARVREEEHSQLLAQQAKKRGLKNHCNEYLDFSFTFRMSGSRREIFKNPRCFLVIARKRGPILETAVQTSVQEFSFKTDSPTLSKMVRIHDITRGDPAREFVIRVFQYKHHDSQLLGQTSCCLDALLAQALSERPQMILTLDGRAVGSLTIGCARVFSDITGGLALNLRMEEAEALRDKKTRALSRETKVHFSGVIGKNLPKGKWLATTKPFFEIWRVKDQHSSAQVKEEFEFVYRSDIAKDTQNPEFSHFEVTLDELCGGQTYKTLLLKIFSKAMMSSKQPTMIGYQRFTLHNLLCASLPPRIQDYFVEDGTFTNCVGLEGLKVKSVDAFFIFNSVNVLVPKPQVSKWKFGMKAEAVNWALEPADLLEEILENVRASTATGSVNLQPSEAGISRPSTRGSVFSDQSNLRHKKYSRRGARESKSSKWRPATRESRLRPATRESSGSFRWSSSQLFASPLPVQAASPDQTLEFKLPPSPLISPKVSGAKQSENSSTPSPQPPVLPKPAEKKFNRARRVTFSSPDAANFCFED